MTEKSLKGSPEPDLVAEARRIAAETGCGMNRALQQATEIYRAWAIANGICE